MADTDVLAKLRALGDAVRYKSGLSSSMTLDEMASAIRELDSGVMLNHVLQGDAVTLEASATSVRDRACEYMYTLPGVDLPFASKVGAYAFQYCSDLTTVDLPTAQVIGSSAFLHCAKLSDLSIPEVVTIYNNAFDWCVDLSEVTLPECTSAGNYAFQSCSDLTTVNAAKMGSTGEGAFLSCANLKSAFMPMLSTVGTRAFMGCSELSDVYAPNIVTLGQSAFQSCQQLPAMTLPNVSTIGSSAFQGCYRLMTMDLTGIWSIPNLTNANAFDQTPLRNQSAYTGAWGSIYVPAHLWQHIRTYGQWSYMSARFASVAHAEGSLVDAFPEGVSVHTATGVTVEESSAEDGVAALSMTQTGAGNYGVCVQLDGLTNGTCYAVDLDMTVEGASYRTGNYRLGLYASPSPKTNFADYAQWLNNVERDNVQHHYTWTFIATGETGYLDLVTSGLNTGSHAIEITGLTVHEATYSIGGA